MFCHTHLVRPLRNHCSAVQYCIIVETICSIPCLYSFLSPLQVAQPLLHKDTLISSFPLTFFMVDRRYTQVPIGRLCLGNFVCIARNRRYGRGIVLCSFATRGTMLVQVPFNNNKSLMSVRETYSGESAHTYFVPAFKKMVEGHLLEIIVTSLAFFNTRHSNGKSIKNSFQNDWMRHL